MGVVRVSIPAPAGVQYSEQTFTEDIVGHGAATALARRIEGTLEKLLIEIPRIEREQITTTTITSLMENVPINFPLKIAFGR
ncbi:MAG TPA: hypothetical protein VF910_03155 [Candidatus Bathyarchaeia archaeon]